MKTKKTNSTSVALKRNQETLKMNSNFKTKIAVLLTTIMVTPYIAHAGHGGDGSGGGNPQHINSQIQSKHSAFEDQVRANAAQEQIEAAASLQQAQLSAAQAVIADQTRSIKWYSYVFKAMNYPFSAQFKNAVNFENIVSALQNAKISVGTNLRVGGQRVTFLSDPATGTLIMDYDYYQTQLAKGKILHTSFIATVLHEGLRLLNLEGSTSYPYSDEYAMALRDSVPLSGHVYIEFWEKVQFSAFFSQCSGANQEYRDFLSTYPDEPTEDSSGSEADDIGAQAVKCKNSK